MIKTSDAYLVAINADSEQTQFLATFGFVPPGSREGASLSSSGFDRLWGNRLSQINNRSLGMSAKWNTLEMNRSVLGGGGEYIDPESTRQTGIWSTSQSNQAGVFENPPYIELTLDDTYDLIGMQIIFDDLGMEWATEIKIGYYSAVYSLMQERIFEIDGANSYFDLPINWQYSDVKKIRVTINKWNLPRRFAKICQIIPGQIRYFNDDNTHSFVLREKISPFESLTIPEYTITFANENQEYNIINPQGLISKLREKMEIQSSIGIITSVGIENINTGNFMLFSWPDSANDETASFICRPDISFANSGFIFSDGRIKTVAQVAEIISTQGKLSMPIFIDPSLQSIQINSKIDLDNNTPLLSAFGQLAISTGGYVKFERDGSYSIKPLVFEEPKRKIDYGAMWEKPHITQMQSVASVTVKYVSYSPASIAFGRSEVLNGMSAIVASEDFQGSNIDISSNFILNEADAKRIGEVALKYFNNRLIYNFQYRGDMSIEVGDMISVETDYGFRNVLVIEHEISYNGDDFLQGRISGIEYGH